MAQFNLSRHSAEKYIIHGTFIDTPTSTALRIRKNCEIVVSNGKIKSITGITEGSPQSSGVQSDGTIITYLKLKESQVICPGLIDCHVHAPQFQQLGTKTDVPLVEWLNKYTFPGEAAFSNSDHTSKIYTSLIRRLLRNGTTTALYFASNHFDATVMLANICAEYGQRAFVGKTCSDQFLPEYYVEKTSASLQLTEEFIVHCLKKWGRDGLVQPVITPRFVPTCSKELLKGLGSLAKKYNCHIQTHAAESIDQVAWVSELYPTEKRDIEILKNFGLLTNKTILAHCCHLHNSEVSEIVEAGSAITSCPYSNILFARATVPIPYFKSLGLKISLGSDIAGGMSSSTLTSIRLATLQDRIDSFAPPDRSSDPRNPATNEKVAKENWTVDYKYAFHIATVGGAESLGIEKEVGVFEVGMKWDALLIDFGLEDMAFDTFEDLATDLVTEVEEGFEKFVNCGDDRNIVRVWVNGKTVCERK